MVHFWSHTCLETVSRTSEAVFLQAILCCGQVEVTAKKSSVKSSLRANSSTAGT